MLQQVPVRIVILTTMLSAIGPCVGSAPADPGTPQPAHVDPLKSQVTFSTNNEDVVSAIQEFVEKSAVPIGMEILVRNGHPASHIVKGFAVPPGTYTVQALLERFRKAFPPLRWISDGTHVNIVVPIDRGIDNPFEDKLSVRAVGTKTIVYWISWLSTQDPAGGFERDRSIGIDSENPNPIFTKPVKLATASGLSVRTVVNQIADQSDSTWVATIHDFKPSEACIEKDGKPVLIYSNPHAVSGRTQVNVHVRGFISGWQPTSIPDTSGTVAPPPASSK